MNYYKITRALAKEKGVDTYAHLVSATLVVVSDMDLRVALGRFDLSPEDLQQRFGCTPLTPQQLQHVRTDKSTWSFNTSR